jgi:hypothetical protein
MHVLVPRYDHTGAEVPKAPRHQNDNVDDSHWEDNIQGVMLRTPSQVFVL